MIIHSIRLKNIKSYGEGPNGDGVTISFESGVNRIAGKNGNGKSTIIEALGYALFQSAPSEVAKNSISTYFTNGKSKAGEIDIIFEQDGETYRVERDVGAQSRRKEKVVQLSDGSICAEGDKEVTAFLCRLFGFEHAAQLADVFSKLVGIKQGRLHWPFEMRGVEAKNYFEPLLEVEIFRQCKESLRPVTQIFRAQLIEKDRALGILEERLRERQDSEHLVGEHQKLLSALQTEHGLAQTGLKQTEAEVNRLAAQERELQEAEKKRQAAEAAAHLAAEKVRNQTVAVAESETAQNSVLENTAAYTAFASTQEQVKVLSRRRHEKSLLDAKVQATLQKKMKDEGDIGAANAAVLELTEQQSKNAMQLAEQETALLETSALLETDQPLIAQLKAESAMAENAHSILGRWVAGLPLQIANIEQSLHEAVSLTALCEAWDEPAYQTLSTRVTEANAMREKLAVDQRGAEESKAVLKGQLAQIAGGICPLLKEACRQFDPAKIQNDLDSQTESITAIRLQSEQAKAAYEGLRTTLEAATAQRTGLASKREQAARSLGDFRRALAAMFPAAERDSAATLQAFARAELLLIMPEVSGDESNLAAAQACMKQVASFASAARDGWGALQPGYQARHGEIQTKLRNHTLSEARKNELLRLGDQLKKEHSSLADRILEKRRAIASLEQDLQSKVTEIRELELGRAPYASVDHDMAATEATLALHQSGFQKYLQSKEPADRLASRRAALDQSAQGAETAAQAFDAAATQAAALRGAYDPSALNKARTRLNECNAKVEGMNVRLRQATDEQARQQVRFAEWRQATAQHTALKSETSRLQAAIDITEKARDLLPKAAPEIAQHLCNRIAKHAQIIYTTISREAMDLAWTADGFKLTIDPNERLFGMLSGGEKTKLALSMTLAMLQQFSGLKFCIFDEPTYGVDADSRHRLADAIIEAQRAAGLGQVFLVSHDDAFEGKIEHEVYLEKSADTGSFVRTAAF